MAAAGERLDRFLTRVAQAPDAGALADFSRSRLQKLIAAGLVSVDGAPCRAALALCGGETLTLQVPAPAPSVLVPEAIALDILFEDAHLLVLNKPAGLSVHPGAGHQQGTLVHALLFHCQDLSGIGGELRPGIVHRLDKDTSGLLVVAKDDRTHLGLSRQFAARTVQKRYRAFVLGIPRPAAATLDTLIARHPKDRKRFSSKVLRGKRAVTDYEVVRHHGGVSELAIVLHTGRTHQIRVHLADRGHPLIADALYGGCAWKRITDKPLRTYVMTLRRQALHAEQLTFVHPMTGEMLQFIAELPSDLKMLQRLLAVGR